MLLNKDIALNEKIRTWKKRKVRLKKKKRYIKKTPFVVESKPNKTKLDNAQEFGPEISNANSIVKPDSKLSNMGSKTGLDSGNKTGTMN